MTRGILGTGDAGRIPAAGPHRGCWPAVLDLGDLAKSRYLEPMATVWITLFVGSGLDGTHALKLLRT